MSLFFQKVLPAFEPGQKMEQFVKENCTTICRVNIKGGSGVKILPIFSNSLNKNSLKAHQAFLDLIEYSGLYINVVNFRRKVLSKLSTRENVRLGTKESLNHQLAFYPKKEDFINANFFKKSKERFEIPDPEKPYLTILGASAIHLVEGLLNEISNEKWEKLNRSPTVAQIIQTSLFKIANNFAHAQLFADDFKKFTQEIEFIHAEIATLLELTSPFKEDLFTDIYSKALGTIIPDELKPYVKSGLGRSATHIYAGVNAAILAWFKSR